MSPLLFIYLPDLEKCPAPSSHLNSRRLSSVFSSLSLATNLAGSEYITRGSVCHGVVSCEYNLVLTANGSQQKLRIQGPYHSSQQWRECGDSLVLLPAAEGQTSQVNTFRQPASIPCRARKHIYHKIKISTYVINRRIRFHVIVVFFFPWITPLLNQGHKRMCWWEQKQNCRCAMQRKLIPRINTPSVT